MIAPQFTHSASPAQAGNALTNEQDLPISSIESQLWQRTYSAEQRAQTWRFAFFLLLLFGSIAFYNSTQDHADQLRTADFIAYSQGFQDAAFGFDDHDDPDQVASFSFDQFEPVP